MVPVSVRLWTRAGRPAQVLSPNRPDRHGTQSLLRRGTDERIPCTRPAIAERLRWSFLTRSPCIELSLLSLRRIKPLERTMFLVGANAEGE